MKSYIYMGAVLVFALVALVLAVMNIVWHAQYPDATDTRLFLMHWKEYTAALVIGLLCVGVVAATDD